MSIEGEYRVVGKKPRREPIIKRWSGLIWFGLFIILPALYSLWRRHQWPFSG